MFHLLSLYKQNVKGLSFFFLMFVIWGSGSRFFKNVIKNKYVRTIKYLSDLSGIDVQE